MNNVTAIQALFAQNAPVGANFEEAFNALKGKKDDDLSSADVATLDELAETFQDFASDPAGWLKKASVSNPRHSWWVKLAQALGASVSSAPASTVSVGAPTSAPRSVGGEPSTDPPALDIEPEQGIDPDALAGGAPPPSRREGGGGRPSGGVPVRTGTSKAAVVTDPVKAPQKEPDAPVKNATAGDNPDDGKAKPPGDTVATVTPRPAQPSPAAPPDLVHDFQSGEDRARLRRELIREKRAAARDEKPAALQRRLDAEEQERQRRLAADALERLRRMSEKETAQQLRLKNETADLSQRVSIQAKADEERRLADQRLAAEQRRLDAQEAERKRLADEEAEERKLQRKEAADARKRNADEAERLARKAREEQEALAKAEALKPKPLIDVTDRTIPVITRTILAYSSYRSWSAWLVEAFRLIRTGTPAEQMQKRAALPHMRHLIKSMKASDDRMEIQAGYHLERLLEVLEAGRDQRDPAWFQANYITGTYGAAG